MSRDPTLFPIEAIPPPDTETCPKCHAVSKLDDCDCLGADPDNVFCPECGAEIPYNDPDKEVKP